MNELEFNNQVDRLKATWPTSFPAEKIKLIWNSVKQFRPNWFEKLVTDMIANNRQAPLPHEFISAAAMKNRVENFGGLPTNPNQIHPSENSIFSKEDIAEIFTMMRKRLNGEITFEELEAYGKVIEAAVKTGRQPVT